MIKMPVVIDGIDDSIASAYGALPDRLYLIAQGGQVTFQGEPGSWGFDPAAQGGKLDRDVLDAISTTRPIWVIAFAPHFVYTNSAALERVGIDPKTTAQGIGHYPDGRLSGVFAEVEGVLAGLGPMFGEIMRRGGA